MSVGWIGLSVLLASGLLWSSAVLSGAVPIASFVN